MILSVAVAGCASAGPDTLQVPDDVGGGGGIDMPAGRTLHIAPSQLAIRIVNGVPAVQAYRATLVEADGWERDVTAATRFEVVDPRFGQFAGPLLLASGGEAGPVRIRASVEGVTASAQLTVHQRTVRFEQGAPADAPALFERAYLRSDCGPYVAEPADGVVVPRNLGELDVHWRDDGNDLFAVALRGDYRDVLVYTTGRPDVDAADRTHYTAIERADWARFEPGRRPLELDVTALAISSAPTKCQAPTRTITMTSEEAVGAVYYWSTDWDARAAGHAGQDILRYDLATPDVPPAPLFAGADRPASCIGCHAVSRDGRRVAVTLEGAAGAGAVMDLLANEPLAPVDPTGPRWSAATFTADGDKLLAVQDGALNLFDLRAGGVLASVPATPGMIASNPEFSPDNRYLVNVEAPASLDWSFTGASIVVRSYDDRTNTFGAPRVVLPYDAGKEVQSYYPSWSPDGQWLAVTRSWGETSFANPHAEVWVVKADGSRPPIQVTSGDVGDSWARWLPAPTFAGDELVYFLSFSSMRPFGALIPAGGRPQIWMAAFFPDRANAGVDPVGLPFHAPFQSVNSSIHAAQWTWRVVR